MGQLDRRADRERRRRGRYTLNNFHLAEAQQKKESREALLFYFTELTPLAERHSGISFSGTPLCRA